jgi:hypothetical protein
MNEDVEELDHFQVSHKPETEAEARAAKIAGFWV